MPYPWTNGYNPYYSVPSPMPPAAMQQPVQQPMQQPMQQPAPICRPVASREEATGTPVDFMGNLMIFPDVQNNRIYTKRWNANSGATEFCEFVPAAQEIESPKEDPVLSAIRLLNEKVDGIAAKMRGAANE